MRNQPKNCSVFSFIIFLITVRSPNQRPKAKWVQLTNTPEQVQSVGVYDVKSERSLVERTYNVL